MADLKIAQIWAANFENNDEIDRIFEETYGDDNVPISQFAESQGEWFYDQDFLYVEKLSGDIENTLKSIQISIENIASIADAWKSKVNSNFSYLIAGDDEDFNNPKSTNIGKTEIIYVGKFNHW